MSRRLLACNASRRFLILSLPSWSAGSMAPEAAQLGQGGTEAQLLHMAVEAHTTQQASKDSQASLL